jgi:hypothetical protein
MNSDLGNHWISLKSARKSWDSHRIQQENFENRWKMKAVFWAKILRIFFGDLRMFSAGKNGKLAGSHRKKSKDFPVGILLPCFIDFLCFPEGTGSYFLIWAQIKNQITQGHHHEALF